MKTLGINGMAFHNAKDGGRWTIQASRTTYKDGITPDNDQLIADLIVAF
jgi:hypothetical protein